MFALAAFAQANAIEVTFERPQRSSRGARARRKGPSRVVALMRRALRLADDEAGTPWLPKLINYPY
jgi:hypothetical protein